MSPLDLPRFVGAVNGDNGEADAAPAPDGGGAARVRPLNRHQLRANSMRGPVRPQRPPNRVGVVIEELDDGANVDDLNAVLDAAEANIPQEPIVIEISSDDEDDELVILIDDPIEFNAGAAPGNPVVDPLELNIDDAPVNCTERPAPIRLEEFGQGHFAEGVGLDELQPVMVEAPLYNENVPVEEAADLPPLIRHLYPVLHREAAMANLTYSNFIQQFLRVFNELRCLRARFFRDHSQVNKFICGSCLYVADRPIYKEAICHSLLEEKRIAFFPCHRCRKTPFVFRDFQSC